MSSTHGCAHRRQGYPERLRRIRFKESKTGKTLAFLTNHFGIRALSVYALCKSRREVELFFER
ncbi:MAG: IS4 family transposase, partial [Gammaproteobacteria bacterium]|nr:IS4 family transposase [Gammaproteobacteria bacterium]